MKCLLFPSGHVSLLCFNPNKPDKYCLNLFRVVEIVAIIVSTLDIHVVIICNEEFGPTHDYIEHLVLPSKSCVILMVIFIHLIVNSLIVVKLMSTKVL